MSPKEASVFHFTKKNYALEGVQARLETGKHAVVLSATSINEALEAVGRFEGKNVQVAILDDFDAEKDDVQTIIQRIRKVAPKVRIIGFSFEGPIRNADASINAYCTTDDLVDIVNKI